MTPLEFTLILLAISFGAGLLGSLLGLGGGVFIVPALTLLLGINIRYAIGASIVSVIATSSGAAAAYVRERLTNLKIGTFLQVAASAGAITGAYVAGLVSVRLLYVIFGVVMGSSAVIMFHKRKEPVEAEVVPDRLSDRLGLHDVYHDQSVDRDIRYHVTGAPLGFGLMYVAGVVSGLLGIGSGGFKVTAMDLSMRLPIKVSTATSNFMIGVTAASSAGVYLARGYISPFIIAPVAVGVTIGAVTGSRLLGRLHSRVVRTAFALALVSISAQMLLKGLR